MHSNKPTLQTELLSAAAAVAAARAAQRTILLEPCAAFERTHPCPAGPLRRKWLVCTKISSKIGVLKSTERKARELS